MLLLIAVMLVAVGLGIDVGARLERRRQAIRHREVSTVLDVTRIRLDIADAFREVNAAYGYDHHPNPIH